MADQWKDDDARVRGGQLPLFTADERARIEGMALDMLNVIATSAPVLRRAAERGTYDSWGINLELEQYQECQRILDAAFCVRPLN